MNARSGLRIAARWHDGRIGDVVIDNSRPRAARALLGRPAAEVLVRVPTLFSVCRTAQGMAARLACAAARGGEDAVPVTPSSVAALRAEMIQEHLWRLLLDWPSAIGCAPRRAEFVHWLRKLRAPPADGDYAAVAVEMAGWLAQEWTVAAVAVFVEKSGAPPPRTPDASTLLATFASVSSDDPAAADIGEDHWLPRQAASTWATTLQAVPPAQFCLHPTLGGVARETGALERQRHAPLVAALLGCGRRVAARYCARVMDLLDGVRSLAAGASADSDPGFDAAPLPGGGGIARVETARGTLLHAARIDGGRVTDYAIVAPTEWNLHPAGTMAREMAARAFEDPGSARRHLHRLTLALDPCVAFEVSLDGADSQY